MKKILSIALTLALVMTLFTGNVFANQGNGAGQNKNKEFKDMKGHWGTESVDKMQSLGILDGYADGTFQPDKTLTQAELAVIIDRLLEMQQDMEDDDTVIDDDDDDFKDVPKWAKDAVAKGAQKNYLNLKRFHSQAQCDRLTACVALAKALDLDPITDFTSNPFQDRGLMNDEDYGYILALYKAGYINGYPNGNFNPNSLLSRAQMASIIANLLEDEDEDADSEDESAPTWATDSMVTASAIKADSASLKWTGASDNVKVVGYKVSYEYDDVEKTKYVTTATTTLTGLEADEAYTITLEAKDAAGNWSDDGPSVEITTLATVVVDAVSPIWPTSAALTVSPSTSGVVTLIWPDAEDNVEVTAYKVYKDGVLVKTLDGGENNFILSGLEADTEYIFKIKALDEAGNRSTYLSKTYLTD